MHPLQAEALAVKSRLRNPQGGRVSSDLEVVPEHVARRQQADRKREAEQAKVRAALKVVEAAWRERQSKPKPVRDFLHISTASSETPQYRAPTINDVLSVVSDFYQMPVVEIISQRRTARPVRVRQIVCYVARHVTTRSLPQIGMVMGGRDHSTIHHAVSKIETCLQTEPGLQLEIDEIRRRLGA